MATIDWSDVLSKYKELDNGTKALVKRATSLDDIKLSNVLFQLGLPYSSQSSRVVLFFPFFLPTDKGMDLGSEIARLDDGDIGKNKEKYTSVAKRLMRIFRLEPNDDLLELRRLIRFLAKKSNSKQIPICASRVCDTFYFWGEKNKKAIFENYLKVKYGSNIEGKSDD